MQKHQVLRIQPYWQAKTGPMFMCTCQISALRNARLRVRMGVSASNTAHALAHKDGLACYANLQFATIPVSMEDVQAPTSAPVILAGLVSIVTSQFVNPTVLAVLIHSTVLHVKPAFMGMTVTFQFTVKITSLEELWL